MDCAIAKRKKQNRHTKNQERWMGCGVIQAELPGGDWYFLTFSSVCDSRE